MKRLLVVDDERPVVEGISLMVKRELSEEFVIADSASSGREAIEKATRLSPDIILMDVRMPGLSGLEAIREIRRRGSSSVFILVTAYERFDIAREAVELGVLDYLLKPVAKDRLALCLRSAATFIDRRRELELREIEHREREEHMRSFVETAFLHSLMLGEDLGPELPRYRAALGLEEPFAMVIAAAFLPAWLGPGQEEEMRRLHESFRVTIRYKTRALVGPLVGGTCLCLLPLREEGQATRAREDLLELLGQTQAENLSRGLLRLGFGRVRPLATANRSWVEALGDLYKSEEPAAEAAGEIEVFEEEEAFLAELLEGEPDRARGALEALLAKLPELPPRWALYRLIALFGWSYRLLERQGFVDAAQTRSLYDLEDLRGSWERQGLAATARARFALFTDLVRSLPRHSSPIAQSMAYVKDEYGNPISLESAAERVGLSPSRLSRLFVEETGRGFSDYLIQYRIERAKELLSLPGASIKQVSISCGYPDPNYFSRLFKKVTGCTPSTFSSSTVEADDEKS